MLTKEISLPVLRKCQFNRPKWPYHVQMSIRAIKHPKGKTQGTVTTEPLRTKLRRTLLDRIIHGQLPPGTRIKEVKVARELEVSRTPLREALLQLERDGFVRSDRDRGFSVEPISPREIRELYPMLWTLEELALRLSGPRVALAIPELSRINRALQRSRESKQALLLDNRWHESLLASSPNRKLRETLASLRLSVRRYELIYMREVTLVATSVRQHAEIIDALKNGNMDLALSKLQENWRFSMDELLVRLGEP
jgi:DNA-binding GntR family transcriptional regulator